MRRLRISYENINASQENFNTSQTTQRQSENGSLARQSGKAKITVMGIVKVYKVCQPKLLEYLERSRIIFEAEMKLTLSKR